MMIISCFSLIATAFIFLNFPAAAAADNVSFYEHYRMLYGGNHAKFLDQGKTQIQLWLDKKSGSAFGSKVRYSSGYFNMSIKLPPGDSAGVIVAFYLRSEDGHGEVDMEFMGNLPGEDIRLQTNVFVDNVGNREQRIILPNARTQNYVYTIVWNPNMLTILWDGQPIRVFRNLSGIVGYPWQPMQVLASIWDGSDWATDGGRIKVNWSHAPFIAEFAEFRVNGCSEASGNCGSSQYWWNRSPYTEFTPELRNRLNRIVRPLLKYDYCTDKERHPVTPPECVSND